MKKALLLTSALILLAGCSGTPATTTDTTTTTDTSTTTNTPAAQPTDSTQDQGMTTYTSTYGFTLDIPNSWAGYTSQNNPVSWGGTADWAFSSPTIYFTSTIGANLFAVGVFTQQQWTDLNAKEDGPKPEKLGENDQFVFGWTSGQDANGISAEYLNAVKASFKAL